ncbi:MAG: DUF1592 domain-containing protein [Myxococcaceae bacterium]|nr:DUF1592 domain-containing protein [Myxococcaceae bacterium]
MRRSLLVLCLTGCVVPEPPLTLGELPSPSASSGTVAPAPLRRLTRAQYHQAVVDLFAPLGLSESPAWRFPGEETAGPFLTRVRTPITSLEVDVAIVAAEEVAAKVAPSAERLFGCACPREGLERLAAKAWRRPLTDDERAGLGALFEAGGVELAVTGILSSASFLAVVERGRPDDPAKLTGHEVATRLALLLAGGLPDDALTAAAEEGRLDTADGIAAETWRLLKEPRARTQLAAFHQQWLGLGGLQSLEKDPTRYPLFGAEARTAMRDELESFVDAVVRRSDGRLETLFSAPFAFVRAPLHRVYGVSEPTPGASVGLDPSERAGILTHPAFLATHASPRLSSPTHRGLAILRNVLCIEPGEPPPGVTIAPTGAAKPGALSRREMIEQHSANPSCRGCHQRLDPFGLAFEHYDAIGVWREKDLDDGSVIDASAEVVLGDEALDGPTKDAVELSKRLGRSQVVLRCAARQWYRFAFGRLETDADAPELAQLEARIIETKGSVPDLIVALTTSDAFRSRAP